MANYFQDEKSTYESLERQLPEKNVLDAGWIYGKPTRFPETDVMAEIKRGRPRKLCGLPDKKSQAKMPRQPRQKRHHPQWLYPCRQLSQCHLKHIGEALSVEMKDKRFSNLH